MGCICAYLPTFKDPLLRKRKLHVCSSDLSMCACVCVCVFQKGLHGVFFDTCVCVCVRFSPEGKALKWCVPESKQLLAEADSTSLND